MSFIDKLKNFWKKDNISSEEGVLLNSKEEKQGQKSDWSYIEVPKNILEPINLNKKKYFDFDILRKNIEKMNFTNDEFGKRKLLNTILLWYIILSILLVFSFWPTLFKEIHILNRTIQMQEEDLTWLKTNDEILEKYKTKVDDFRKLLLIMRKSIPNKSDEEQTVNFVNEYLIKSQKIKYIDFDSISFKPKLEANIEFNTLDWKINKNLYKIQYDLKFSWLRNYKDLKEILHIIDTNYRFYEITDINFTVVDNQNISIFWVLDPTAPKKTATLSITMYSYYLEDKEKRDKDTWISTGLSDVRVEDTDL